MRFLVTGVGGDIGINICRILRDKYPASKVFCSDIHSNVPYSYINATLLALPRADSHSYLRALENIVLEHSIDYIIPTSEHELRYLTEYEETLADVLKRKIIWASRSARIVGFDKARTMEFLQKNCFANLSVSLNSDGLPLNFPCIYKSRTGAGSTSVFKVENPEQAYYFKKLYPDYLWQSYASGKNGEYTACLFSDGTNIRTLIFERTLSGGVSRTAKIVCNNDYVKYIESIGNALKFKGSINIQFRVIGSIPHVFEINPRFSSTIKMRDLIGFSDLIWSIQSINNDSISPFNMNKSVVGKTIYRLNDEYIQ